MKLTILGTGNALVTKYYNTCFVLEEEGELFLVDGGGGNGILGQLERAGFELKDIKDIFVTHKHVDHLIGILWLIRVIGQSMNKGKIEGDVNIYGHGEVLDLLRSMTKSLLSKSSEQFLDQRIHLIEVVDEEERMICGHKVTFFDIRSTKAKQFAFTMDIGDGKILTCCGDEPYYEHEKKYCEKADWLLHEAFCLNSQVDLYNPYKISHCTVKDACQNAEQLQVKNLIIYHTEDDNFLNRKELYTDEGKEYFHGNLYVPDDLEVFEL